MQKGSDLTHLFLPDTDIIPIIDAGVYSQGPDSSQDDLCCDMSVKGLAREVDGEVGVS